MRDTPSAQARPFACLTVAMTVATEERRSAVKDETPEACAHLGKGVQVPDAMYAARM